MGVQLKDPEVLDGDGASGFGISVQRHNWWKWHVIANYHSLLLHVVCTSVLKVAYKSGSKALGYLHMYIPNSPFFLLPVFIQVLFNHVKVSHTRS